MADGDKQRISAYADSDARDRIRAAYAHTHAREGHASLSDFIVATLLKEAERLERAYNDGHRFPGGATGTVPPGRPVRL